MTIPHKIIWYYYSIPFPIYEERMHAMAHYIANSEMHRYYVDTFLQLVPKE